MVENKSVRIQNLEDFEHVNILVQDVMCEDPWNQ